jgi:hypothetical protein
VDDPRAELVDALAMLLSLRQACTNEETQLRLTLALARAEADLDIAVNNWLASPGLQS